MSTNTGQPNTDTQPQSDEEKLDEVRKLLDNVKTVNGLYYSNTTRKKVKRWFKKCAKKEYNDAQPGELCYKFEGNDLYLGRKDNNCINPRLLMSKDRFEIQEYLHEKWDKHPVIRMSYDEFYKYYKKIVKKGAIARFFEDACDGFISITQIPRQIISGNRVKATSPGGHIANIATRVLSPVTVPVTLACAGAKALKDKIIPTDEELWEERRETINTYMNHFNNKEDKDAKEWYQNSVRNILKDTSISEEDKFKMLKSQIDWYNKNIFIPKNNLNSVHSPSQQK